MRLSSKALTNLLGIVGGGVNYEDAFEILVGLLQDAADGAAHEPGVVVRGDDDQDGGLVSTCRKHLNPHNHTVP